ncbi:programmed cell death protein 7 [Lingula anatina]|uniref:Programmed cell death protein 7 n=1 Tax=Lingula anatina TaxID=7574 RepID=A0A1S3GY03_LINAN|nr:programmed cell death protein 7 [Lingula anatina]XP_013378749.1 programmed cell death protein 7 [Lingula anatina]XP_013378750.1 programmed cell death protein 7 [Lingula anatina]XP_013378751.1 programmed cell death protein 7 [Lingula anatina]XP_013378752.1 programmed cell death protein 7 [Lingula anatina]|eukprot:XP_013378748.1 programmed cell death protein 7 [Lingula anatina]
MQSYHPPWQHNKSQELSQPQQTNLGMTNMPLSLPPPQQDLARFSTPRWSGSQQQAWMQSPPGYPPPPPLPLSFQQGPPPPPQQPQPQLDFSYNQGKSPSPSFPGESCPRPPWPPGHSGGRPYAVSQGYSQPMNKINNPQLQSNLLPPVSHTIINPYHYQDKGSTSFERQYGMSDNENFFETNSMQSRPEENAGFQPHSLENDCKSVRDADREWVKRWLSSRCPVKSEQGSEKKVINGSVSIPEYQDLVKSTILIFDQLKSQQQNLREHLHDVNFDWEQNYAKSLETKLQLQRLKETLLNPNLTKVIAKKIKRAEKRKIRREKQKRSEKLSEVEALKRREELHKQIDAWQNAIYQKDQDKKRAKDLKSAADSILGEVRKKNIEALKAIQLVEGLQKLRTLRMKRAHERGLHPPKECDQVFEDTTKTLLEMMNKQKETYEAEQRTLEVMLETEQEENLEKEREEARLKKEVLKRKKERKIKEWLFGKEVPLLPGDLLYPFRQYYDQAENSVESLLQIRQQWDNFLVSQDTPGSSHLPVGWVIPNEPSSETWASALS